MVHAEVNAILTAARDLTGCKLYVTNMLPCSGCAKQICQTGINEVVVVNEVKRTEGKDWNFSATLKMFKQCKIKIRKIIVPILKIP